MLTVNPDVVVDELESTKKILDKWLVKFNKGLPVVDEPGSEEQLELLMREFCGELRICAGKCGNLAAVLLGDD